MAMSSDLIAAMPEPFAGWSAGLLRLSMFPLPVVTPEVDIALSWHPRYQADPVHCWLRRHVRATTESSWH
jgi:DNA-binding transcriptional LysR family regulator